MLVLLIEYYSMVFVMFFVSYFTAIILLAFGLIGANRWRINQEKLYIADEKMSKIDKLVFIIILFPIVTLFLMFLLAMFNNKI